MADADGAGPLAGIGLVIVDDDPLVRTGLKLILGGAPEITVLAEAADGQEAEQVVTQHRPDVVLMDIRMPAPTGSPPCAPSPPTPTWPAPTWSC